MNREAIEARKKMFPMNLQLFAEGGGEGGGDGADGKKQPPKKEDAPGGAGGGSDDDGDDDGDEEGDGGKTYTQEEVNALLAREKRQGKNAVLKKLGLKDVNEGLTKLGVAKKDDKKQPSKEEDKADDAVSKEAMSKLEQRALMAERKAVVLGFGASKDDVDDIVLIASSKVTDEEDFESIVEEMSKDKRYAAFFGKAKDEDSSAGGTGSGVGFKKDTKKATAGSFGKKLAEKQKSSYANTEKKTFFDN